MPSNTFTGNSGRWGSYVSSHRQRTQNQVGQLAFWMTQSGSRRLQLIKNMTKISTMIFHRDKSIFLNSGLKNISSIYPLTYSPTLVLRLEIQERHTLALRHLQAYGCCQGVRWGNYALRASFPRNFNQSHPQSWNKWHSWRGSQYITSKCSEFPFKSEVDCLSVLWEIVEQTNSKVWSSFRILWYNVNPELYK